jgi:hypothetical protein
MPTYKLGKLAPKFNPKTLKFSAYLNRQTPLMPPPEKNFWEYKIPPATIGMYLNDEIGDCTIAEVAHHIMLLSAHTGTMVVITDAQVQAMYSAISGYDPSQTDASGNNPTDTGCAITDVLAYWQNTGLAGHKIDGWVSINPTNLNHRNLATYLFGGCSVGVQLPAAAQTQFSNGQEWFPVAGDQIEGGHCIMESGYGSAGRNFETWGKGDQKATNAWDQLYVDEVYCVLSKDWINIASGLAPNALNYAALQTDLQAVKA